VGGQGARGANGQPAPKRGSRRLPVQRRCAECAGAAARALWERGRARASRESAVPRGRQGRQGRHEPGRRGRATCAPSVPASGPTERPAPRGAEEEGVGHDLGPPAPRSAGDVRAPGSISPSTRAAGAAARGGRGSGDVLTPGGPEPRKKGGPKRKRGTARQAREGSPGRLRRAVRAPPPGPGCERPEAAQGAGNPRVGQETSAGPRRGAPGSLRRDDPSTHRRGQRVRPETTQGRTHAGGPDRDAAAPSQDRPRPRGTGKRGP